MVSIEHITQPAVLVEELDAAMDWLHAAFGAYPSERVDIKSSGVNNAVYAFANRTYLELIEPYDTSSSAFRLLSRSGPGWHMMSVDIVHDDWGINDAAIRSSGMRVVQTNRSDNLVGAWHLHPRDTGGVLLNLADPADHAEHGMWAGRAWREYVATNTHIVDRILGVSIVTNDLDKTRQTWTSLGLDFGEICVEESDDVIKAQLAAGTFLQVRQPRSTSAPSQAALEQHGPGLYHLCWGVHDIETTRSAMAAVNADVIRYSEKSFWTTADSTGISVPMEFRLI